jgi:hypothetical protein
VFSIYKLPATTAALLILASTITFADQRYNVITDSVVSDECGECHMAFQPQMLPRRSWIKIMNDLSNHFGEDASLDEATNKHVKAYLVQDAADTKLWASRFLRGISDDMIPLRITQTPHWLREHNDREIEKFWGDPKNMSKANCLACHPGANRGNYDD